MSTHRSTSTSTIDEAAEIEEVEKSITEAEHKSDADANDNTQLPYTGVLKQIHIDKLLEQFGDNVLIPGLKMRLARTDDDGLVLVPGCLSGYYESKRILRSWVERNTREKEDNEWWLAHLARKGLDAIYMRDLLTGLRASRWKEYKRVYTGALSMKRTTRHRAVRKARVKQEVAKSRKEKRDDVAHALVDFANAK